VNSWNTGWWRTLLLPGGALFLLSVGIFSGGLFRIPPATLGFCYAAVFLGGLLLSWRFHSGRTFSALILLLLAHRAVEFFGTGHSPVVGAGRTALEAVSFFLAVNFIWLAAAGEFGFSIAAFAPRLGVLFLESVFVAVICRPQPAWGSDLFRGAWLPRTWFAWTRISQFSWLVLAVAFVFLVIRAVQSRKQIDAAFAWALAAVACAFSSGQLGHVADGYIASAGLLLLVGVVETSYRMAYHDELTGIPSRRALNDARTGLEPPYTIAVVDVDHFKQFNDTHGHDTGDEVLRMVAKRLGEVAGGGRAYRVGGEEFTILFARMHADDALPHLEQLRQAIEATVFRLRGYDRRLVARGPERRSAKRTSGRAGKSPNPPSPRSVSDLKVTVSIGVAEASERALFDAALERADKALYRAKQNGRNRTEVDGRVSQKEAALVRKRKSGAKSA
jgi:GGDEF domain-containing protein